MLLCKALMKFNVKKSLYLCSPMLKKNKLEQMEEKDKRSQRGIKTSCYDRTFDKFGSSSLANWRVQDNAPMTYSTLAMNGFTQSSEDFWLSEEWGLHELIVRLKAKNFLSLKWYSIITTDAAGFSGSQTVPKTAYFRSTGSSVSLYSDGYWSAKYF